MKPVTLFAPKIEKFNLLFPLPFIVVGIFEAFKFISFRDQLFRERFSYVSLIIFLNYLHVFFTPFFISVLPSGRKWFKEKCRADKSQYWIGIILLIAIYRYFIYPQNQPTIYLDLLFTGILEIFAIYHNASQTFGLSLLYNKKAIEAKVTTKEALKVTEPWERRLFHFQFILLTTTMIARRTPIGDNIIYYVLPIAMFISAIQLGLIYLQTRSIQSYKFIYSLRFLLYPLTLNSFVATMGILSFHGVDYLFVTQKLMEKEEGNYQIPVAVFAFLLLFITVVFSYNYFLDESSLYWIPFQLLNAFFSMFILLNYSVDVLMFK